MWFKENHMKPNGDKRHLLVTTEKSVGINNDGSNVKNKKEQKLLGIINTRFDSTVFRITLQVCKKASQKLHALVGIVNCMDLPKRKVLMKAFITSQFSYCPLIWMLHSRALNDRINYINKRALRLTYKDNQSSFKEYLEKDHSVTVHLLFKIQTYCRPNIRVPSTVNPP